MQTDLETTLAETRSASSQWLALVQGLSPAQANWRPAPDRWSIVQCMDHLNITTGLLIAPLNAAVTTARSRGVLASGPFRYGFIARWFLKSLAPRGSKPIPVPQRYRPSSSQLELATVVSRFQEVQQSFIAVAESADGLDLARIRISSPALKLLRLPLGIWLLSTASHMLRHLYQAQGVRSHEQFPVNEMPVH